MSMCGCASLYTWCDLVSDAVAMDRKVDRKEVNGRGQV